MAQFNLSAEEVRAGVPVVIEVTTNEGALNSALVVPIKTESSFPSFSVPLIKDSSSGHVIGTLTLQVPGVYKIKVDETEKILVVSDQKYLSFPVEFGIFSASVVLILSGLLLWLKKRKATAGKKWTKI